MQAGSADRRSITARSNTKKPPEIRPSPAGFSAKRLTSTPSWTSSPKRDGGLTPVTVASLPCERWKAISSSTSMSATPSP
jgi:hypothetical protein